jgi:hypothetical protein
MLCTALTLTWPSDNLGYLCVRTSSQAPCTKISNVGSTTFRLRPLPGDCYSTLSAPDCVALRGSQEQSGAHNIALYTLNCLIHLSLYHIHLCLGQRGPISCTSHSSARFRTAMRHAQPKSHRDTFFGTSSVGILGQLQPQSKDPCS